MPLLSGSEQRAYSNLGSTHCIHRLTRPLDPPMLLVVCSKVTESENVNHQQLEESPWIRNNNNKSLNLRLNVRKFLPFK